MRADDVSRDLLHVARTDDFAQQCADLVESWTSADAGIESVEPILRFMEAYPDIDYGTPGALVHFVEGFYGCGYEEKLVESIRRAPTTHTVWMLNRIINGARSDEERRLLVATLEQVTRNTAVDSHTLDVAAHFLERLS